MNSQAKRPLIALVSAVPGAIPPAEAAFADLYPDAIVWNILDDRLLVEADARGGVTPELSERMSRLIRHAVTEGAEGILLTCSMYGPVAHALAADIGVPLFAADDAAFDAAVTGGYGSVLLISPAAGPLVDSVDRLRAAAVGAGVELEVTGAVADGAATAARGGDIELLASILHKTVSAQDGAFDAVVLGQYSISPGATRLAELTGLPVIAGPQKSAIAIQAAVSGRES